MDFKKLLSDIHLESFPSGLGGCHCENMNYSCCEYDITVFDNKNEIDSVIEYNQNFVRIHHGIFSETDSGVLLQYDKMKIINDDSWELKMFLSKIQQKREHLFRDHAKNCLIDSLFCAARCLDGIKNNDVFSSSWIKSGSFSLVEAICSLNNLRISPTHMLEKIRKLESNSTNENMSKINDILGIERSTPSLLSRMMKSTVGFSDMVENNGHSKIIAQKYDYLVKNSLLSDCYFYLGLINKNLFFKIKNNLSRQQDMIHVIKTAYDLESEQSKLVSQSHILKDLSNEILATISNR